MSSNQSLEKSETSEKRPESRAEQVEQRAENIIRSDAKPADREALKDQQLEEKDKDEKTRALSPEEAATMAKRGARVVGDATKGLGFSPTLVDTKDGNSELVLPGRTPEQVKKLQEAQDEGQKNSNVDRSPLNTNEKHGQANDQEVSTDSKDKGNSTEKKPEEGKERKGALRSLTTELDALKEGAPAGFFENTGGINPGENGKQGLNAEMVAVGREMYNGLEAGAKEAVKDLKSFAQGLTEGLEQKVQETTNIGGSSIPPSDVSLSQPVDTSTANATGSTKDQLFQQQDGGKSYNPNTGPSNFENSGLPTSSTSNDLQNSNEAPPSNSFSDSSDSISADFSTSAYYSSSWSSESSPSYSGSNDSSSGDSGSGDSGSGDSGSGDSGSGDSGSGDSGSADSSSADSGSDDSGSDDSGSDDSGSDDSGSGDSGSDSGSDYSGSDDSGSDYSGSNDSEDDESDDGLE